MAINRLLGAFAFALALLTVSASEEAANEHKGSTNNDKILPIQEAVAKDETRNGTQFNLDYSISVTMVNYGSGKVKVQQRYMFPDGVEVKTFTLQKDGYRSRRSTDNQKFTQWVGGTIDLKPSDVKEADMTYINHPAQVVNPNSKTFHKLSTAIMIKEGDLVGGQISSPNNPFSYPNGADLTWLIIYPEDNVVKLQMEDYATEECCDRVIVYDGYSQSHSPLATFEGDYSYSSSNNVVFSSQPAMFIRFTSDCLTTNRGFRASYINQRKSKAPAMSCGNVQQTNNNEGYIQSPNYPGTYDEYMNCTWPVQTYYNTRVKFVFYNFTIGTEDYVAIYEGSPSIPGNRIASFNSNVYSGYTVYASSNEAFVLFTSGYTSYYADMFVISYAGVSNYPQTTTSEPMSCGSVESTGHSGSITSPNYPGTYDAYMNCTWAVQTYYNARVKFVLEYFYTGSDDQVSFYEGTPSDPGNHIRTISGSYSTGYSIYASSSQAFVFFTSGDNSYYYNKFIISYDADYNTPVTTTESYYDQTNATAAIYYDPPQCNDTVSSPYGSSGVLYSPGYNSPGYYPINDYCIWYVTTSSYYDAIRFYPYYFSTEYRYDWVRIFNGHSTSQSNLINQISGNVDPYTTLAVSNSRYATVTFSSDYSINDRGFNIRFSGTYYSYYTTAVPAETTSTSMNGTCPYPYISGSSGYVESPYYPNDYHYDMNCSTWVNTPYGTSVQLTVEYFDLASGDYVSIYNGYTGDYLRYMIGEYSYGNTWQAPTNYIQILFISDSFATSSGYSFRFEAIYDSSYYTTASPSTCGGAMPFNYGVITSPYFPGYYTNSLDCVWTVTVNSNMYVLFTIEYFNTEYCCDQMSFYGGTPDNPSSRVDYLSGWISKGYEIMVPDDQAWVSFYTDSTVTDLGFNITYQPVTTGFIPNHHATTDSYDGVTQGYNGATQWVRSGIKVENGPKTLGKDLWGKEQNKPAHLRKEKMNNEDQRQDTLN